MTDIQSTATVPEFVRAIAATHGDRPAIVLDEHVLTYRALEAESAEMARGLLARGVGKGSRIGLLLPNSPEFAVAWAAVSRIGAVAVPLSTYMKGRELGRVVRHADLAGLIGRRTIVSQDFAQQLESALPGLADVDVDAGSGPLALPGAPFLRWVVLSGDDRPAWARGPDWLTAGAAAPYDDSLLAAVESEVHPQDPALMIYTSGQSADPKGVPHTHGGLINKVHYLTEMMGVTAEHAPEAVMPFFWVGGLAITLFPTFEAGGVVICHEKPTVAVLPLGNVSRGGEPEPPPGWKAFSSLGMTETFAIYAWGTVSLVGSHPYVPLDFFEPGYDVKVVDPMGRPVPDGARGEILIRGPSVTPGHHKVPRSTYFDADGFFKTGDEGLVDGDRIHFLGRLGDMIKTRMANVAPPEVEQEIVALDGVATAYVVAVDDPTLGQAVGAAIVPEEGADLTPEAIAAALRSEISTFKVPKVMVIVPNEEIPVTPSNKLNKRALAALIAERGQWVSR